MKESRTTSDRKIATWVGILYLIATVPPVAALVPWGRLTDGPGILTNTNANEGHLILANLLYLTMALAVAGVAFMIYPILRRVADTAVKRALAIWYVGTRATEGVIFVVAVVASLAFIPLSRAFIAAGAPADSHFQVTAETLQWSNDVAYALGQTVFAFGAFMFYYLLWQSRLIPRWLSGWGFVASPLFVVASLSLLWTGDPSSTLSTVLYIPMAAQEMIMAGWLIVKGFNSNAPDDHSGDWASTEPISAEPAMSATA